MCRPTSPGTRAHPLDRHARRPAVPRERRPRCGTRHRAAARQIRTITSAARVPAFASSRSWPTAAQPEPRVASATRPRTRTSSRRSSSSSRSAAHTACSPRVRARHLEHQLALVVVGMLIGRPVARRGSCGARSTPALRSTPPRPRRCEVQLRARIAFADGAPRTPQFSTAATAHQVYARLSARFLALHPLTDADFMGARASDAPPSSPCVRSTSYPPSLHAHPPASIAGMMIDSAASADSAVPCPARCRARRRFLREQPVTAPRMPSPRRPQSGAQFRPVTSSSTSGRVLAGLKAWAAEHLAAPMPTSVPVASSRGSASSWPKRVAA